MPHEYWVEEIRVVSAGFAAIQNAADGVALPCRAVSVDTAGNYTLTNPDGTTIVIVLAAGVLHWITTKVAFGTPAGTVTYWY